MRYLAKKLSILAILTALILSISGCSDDPSGLTSNPVPTSSNELTTSLDFDWSTMDKLPLEITVNSAIDPLLVISNGTSIMYQAIIRDDLNLSLYIDPTVSSLEFKLMTTNNESIKILSIEDIINNSKIELELQIVDYNSTLTVPEV